ncbi:MAG: AcrR family transcriptional regulator, partial [Granulosicoccus sp.]
QLFRESGFEAFSMGELCRRSAMAKGTLYIYFRTREEVLLELYHIQLESWAAGLIGNLKNVTDDQTFVVVFHESAQADKSFLALVSRLDSVIEHNISLEKLIETKRYLAKILKKVAQSIAPILKFDDAQSFDALSSLASLQLGISQVDAGPQLKDKKLPEDVRQLVDSFSPDKQFITNAVRIISGIRAGL